MSNDSQATFFDRIKAQLLNIKVVAILALFATVIIAIAEGTDKLISLKEKLFPKAAIHLDARIQDQKLRVFEKTSLKGSLRAVLPKDAIASGINIKAEIVPTANAERAAEAVEITPDSLTLPPVASGQIQDFDIAIVPLRPGTHNILLNARGSLATAALVTLLADPPRYEDFLASKFEQFGFLVVKNANVSLDKIKLTDGKVFRLLFPEEIKRTDGEKGAIWLRVDLQYNSMCAGQGIEGFVRANGLPDWVDGAPPYRQSNPADTAETQTDTAPTETTPQEVAVLKWLEDDFGSTTFKRKGCFNATVPRLFAVGQNYYSLRVDKQLSSISIRKVVLNCRKYDLIKIPRQEITGYESDWRVKGLGISFIMSIGASNGGGFLWKTLTLNGVSFWYSESDNLGIRTATSEFPVVLQEKLESWQSPRFVIRVSDNGQVVEPGVNVERCTIMSD